MVPMVQINFAWIKEVPSNLDCCLLVVDLMWPATRNMYPLKGMLLYLLAKQDFKSATDPLAYACIPHITPQPELVKLDSHHMDLSFCIAEARQLSAIQLGSSVPHHNDIFFPQHISQFLGLGRCQDAFAEYFLQLPNMFSGLCHDQRV